MKYRRELTPYIKFQADRIFVRNDLFEQVINTCKSNSREFLMFKEKLWICPYGELNEKYLKCQMKNLLKIRMKNQTMNQIKNHTMNQLKK